MGLIKTDNNGTIQWEKLLNQEGMISSKGAIVEQDGFVVAGTKRNVAGPCSECDSVFIVKIDNSGNLVWKNAVVWGFNTTVFWDASITRQLNGHYVVSNGYSSGFFFFSPSGVFIDRKLSAYQVHSAVLPSAA